MPDTLFIPHGNFVFKYQMHATIKKKEKRVRGVVTVFDCFFDVLMWNKNENESRVMMPEGDAQVRSDILDSEKCSVEKLHVVGIRRRPTEEEQKNRTSSKANFLSFFSTSMLRFD